MHSQGIEMHDNNYSEVFFALFKAIFDWLAVPDINNGFHGWQQELKPRSTEIQFQRLPIRTAV